MIAELQHVIELMRRSLDWAITNGEEPLVDLWSQAIECVEQARRLAVKGGVPREVIYKQTTVTEVVDIYAPIEETIGRTANRGCKAAGIHREQWYQMARRCGADHILTPYGVIPVVVSETCPMNHIEWYS